MTIMPLLFLFSKAPFPINRVPYSMYSQIEIWNRKETLHNLWVRLVFSLLRFYLVIRSVIGSRWRQQQITTWTTRRVTRGSGGREIREEITRYGCRWSVTEWPPTDQFQDKHPGENARSNRAPISHRVHGHQGFVLHAVKLGLRFPARALRMDLAWSYLRERRAPRRYSRAREWPEGVSKPVSDWLLSQPITCIASWRGNTHTLFFTHIIF